MTSTSIEMEPTGTVTRSGGATSLLPLAGMAAVLVGTLAVLVLHVVPPTSSTSPYRRTISEYAYSTLGWVFNAGVLAIAAGSLLIAFSLWASRALRPLSVGSLGVVAWGVSLVVLVIFPKHDWSVGPSGHGSIHRVASLVAFFSVPLAAVAIARHREGRLRPPAVLVRIFGVVSGCWLGMLIGGFVLGPITGTPWYRVFPLGLMERGMAFFAIAAVLAAGWLAIRAATHPAQTVRRR